ncbi:hypothetical protein [Brevundimonas sp.]|uniref:hypothetical protein n=1 Tax=Brevundimonas sp. TaxID=1871086 RepID=UPI0035AF9F09
MQPSFVISELRRLIGPEWRDEWSVCQAAWVKVSGFAMTAGVTETEAYDLIGEALARAYALGQTSYEDADLIANNLYGAWVLNRQSSDPPSPWPELFLEVYLAFDGGEYRRTDNPTHDPVVDCTDPAIAEILKRLNASQETTG